MILKVDIRRERVVDTLQLRPGACAAGREALSPTGRSSTSQT